MAINELTEEQLETLHVQVVYLRNQVNEICGEHGYSASQLVSRTYEHEIESAYGRKKLKKGKIDD